MIRALKVVMIVYGVMLILVGLMDIFAHDTVIKMFGITGAASYVKWLGEVIGALYIAIGVWIIAAGRDPLRNISWLKFVILKCILLVVITAHSILAGFVDFSQVGQMIIIYGIFAVVFLALYPWRAARTSQ